MGKQEKLVIVGDGEFAEIACEYFTHDSPYEVVGFRLSALLEELIGDNCFLSSHVVISGYCTVGESYFFGVNSTIGDRVTRDTEAGKVYKSDREAQRVSAAWRSSVSGPDKRPWPSRRWYKQWFASSLMPPTGRTPGTGSSPAPGTACSCSTATTWTTTPTGSRTIRCCSSTKTAGGRPAGQPARRHAGQPRRPDVRRLRHRRAACGRRSMLDLFDALQAAPAARGDRPRVVYKPVPHIYHRCRPRKTCTPCSSTAPGWSAATSPRPSRMADRPALSKGRKWSRQEGAGRRPGGPAEPRLRRLHGHRGGEPAAEVRRHADAHGRRDASCWPAGFPDNIKLFGAYRRRRLLGGVIVYENRQVAHAQYIAASDEGKELAALDCVFDVLLERDLCRQAVLRLRHLHRGRRPPPERRADREQGELRARARRPTTSTSWTSA